ncbi:BamA/TamA family outer membrane protein [Catalinimonas niigatensis]|uniref:BamA/TamA family outer membrane protein n=1 Tax=Catalinimonas niigatensis TaxID=1397264 RepID=UPI0026655251|nr:BamA/TamA family outer membrane protein [Catalinimonas niigatensis]WPP53144.1 BamA/TamA family outer membrane protein [Catalinimonas niigatensis]
MFSCFFHQQVRGQAISVISSEQDKQILKHYDLSVRQPDSLGALQAVGQLISKLQSDGYFTASASHLQSIDSSQWQVNLDVGDRYHWAYLQPGNLNPLMQEHSGFRERFFLNRPFSYEDVQRLMENILKAAENEGFPFASVQLTQVRIENNEVQAAIHYTSGPYITFGDLEISGTSKVKPDFLATILKIASGSAYSEKKVSRIQNTLRSIPYLELSATPKISFQNDEAEVHLTLEERESNQMDGLVNLLPNENEGGNLLLTGKVEILLNNLMKSGKQFNLQWQRLQVESQQLSVNYQHPYLFRTPFQAGIGFNILKEDTLYINRNLSFNLSYPLSQASLISFTTDIRNSHTLTEARPPVNTNNLVGSLGNFSLLNVGVSLQLNRLNDILLPTRGWHLYSSVGIGRKSSQDISIETEEEINWQPFTRIDLRQYHSLGKFWVIFYRLSGAYLHGENLYLNDLYRLGGLNSLRGFNDNFFFASYYGLSNLELRLLLEHKEQTQSYLYIFYDQAILGRQGGGGYQVSPLGLGLGISLTTEVGIFNLAYALGKVENEALNFSLSKIHFGYISRF